MHRVILMYHDIYRDSPGESGFQNPTAIKYKVSASEFEKQVAAIDEYIRTKNLKAEETIDFTFDDGGVSFLTLAAPILEKYGFKGKFYISTGYIGTEGFLDADQIRELNQRGHIVGSHSHSHPERMSAMPVDAVNEEWRVSQEVLADVLGFRSRYASIPNGYQSKAVLTAMISAGIDVIDTSATTTRVGRFENATIRGRYAVTDGMSVDEVMSLLSSPLCRFRKDLRWRMLSIAKCILGNSYLKIRKALTK